MVLYLFILAFTGKANKRKKNDCLSKKNPDCFQSGYY